VRFDAGATRVSLALQASLERRHARRADLVITVSRSCAERLEEMYGVRGAIVVPDNPEALAEAIRHLYQ